MKPDEYCQGKTQQSSSSFYYSFLFLNDTQRQAMTALYAYCREVDDVVDECTDQSVAGNKLNWWREEIHSIYHGTPNHPVAIALKTAINHYPMQEKHFMELIAGMEMDLHTNQYASFNELSLYCYRVASVVGLLTIEILGYSDINTRDYAKNLGLSLQLINILRDIKEDAQRGRIYIPQDELVKFKVTKDMLLSNKNNAQTKALFSFQAKRAEDYYEQAFAALAPGDRYAQRTGIIMAEIYHALLNKIQTQNFPVLEKRVSLAKLKKLWIAWSTARREYRFSQKLTQAPTK
ncbi:MAG: presqualene diphosphate synthase HpnD [gamma proteobacterium symbiont of Bathyaustriella thionipta]|nr:presqualene diphosphate synthase HpnD [gamma proteobacterium symbiont of Bathyaustriella thionipta]MCU7949540.1 presqualene diphosphate synthase HpnD [gamma proteobacterium symbiont of Bathyaustriella thionipta]MCU7952322.1 presqualene diphosphate synthase HpnD [gamma proteobacterium symbiont of Bathyaustriella thionipta]MCU7956140.1 presqualene diphosphate synthase HpnD [gamma proteobacterium symbiont of Bathyaustriella thionipta]MCU7967148.1 presqualene diphosphate synthase HpnD [gamma pro